MTELVVQTETVEIPIAAQEPLVFHLTGDREVVTADRIRQLLTEHLPAHLAEHASLETICHRIDTVRLSNKSFLEEAAVILSETLAKFR